MASKHPNHQGADDATPSPKRRTFRLSEIPSDMTPSALQNCLDSLQVTIDPIEGNSKVSSLATYGCWQVATVSFDTVPEEFKRCAPGHEVHVRLIKKQVDGRAVPVSVTIDCDFYSMTPLYEPPGTTARYDIIAVTGLSAHAYGSWKSPHQADMMWLRDFLPLDLPDIRVLTWGYHSSIQSEISTTSITAISRNFLEDIKQVRDKETAHRPLILIGHSLGGLVLQNALVDASKSNSVEEKAFHQSCIGTLFFGVPHQGLDPRSIGALVQGKGNEHFLRDLMSGSDYLFELRKNFEICYQSMKSSMIVSFYESEDTRSVQKTINQWERCGTLIRMVPRESAICHMAKHDDVFEIRADHSRMVKFRSRSDEHYKRVIAKIKEITESYGIIRAHGRLKDDEIPQIMSWISPLESNERHCDIRQCRLEGTGEWFLLQSSFQTWSDSHSSDGNIGSVFACSGVPGAGKSVMCSLVIDHLQDKFSSEERVCVTYLYCDYQNDKKQTPVNMIGVLLKQVIAKLNKSGLLPADTITKMRERLIDHNKAGLVEACRLLRETVSQLRRFYVCIDALDEFNEENRRDFIKALATIASDCGKPGLIHIFFTTRP
ncbi:hypothetical protein BZA77DRAFT_64442, partial [Pyronema omphalodes]